MVSKCVKVVERKQSSMFRICISALMGIVMGGGMSANLAIATPLSAQSLIQIRQFENPTPNSLFNTVTTNSSFSNTLGSAFGSDIQAHGSLATGETGTRYTITSPDSGNGQSLVNLYDTLTFTTPTGSPTTIAYGLNFDGSLANTGTGFVDGAMADTSVSIYDITGLSSWLEDFDATGTDPIIGTNAPRISFTGILLGVGTQNLIDAIAPFADQTIVDSTGSPFAFNLSKTGSFLADPTKTYGIEIRSASSANGISSSDFLNTSAFQFTSLNGASFTSGSGVFLSQSGNPAPIPEPSTMLLLGSGLAGIAFWRWRGKQAA